MFTRVTRYLPIASWQPLVFYGALLATFGAALWLNLGTLVGGYSAHEQQALQATCN